jgi:2-keto-4-pentenoate hydratase/2-oxohepta-3-ene-1,7-dioic acid hydratase in catechol pathway
MKLATLSAGGAPEVGIVRDDGIVSLSRAAPAMAPDMIALISRWPGIEAEVRRIAGSSPRDFLLSDVRLTAPVQRPGKIFAIGLNYADHIAESKMPAPEHQVWFTKAVTAINDPYGAVELTTPSFVDYEVEMVVVIGRGGRRFAAENAQAAVFGYCVGNDVSERMWQHRTPQWSLGKSFDTHAPIGPWITTADEVGNPHTLDISCSVNGERRQNSNTAHLVFDVWKQIEHLSQAMTLEPGDLIFTGTPGGVGAAMDPRVFLKAGDRVRCEIERLGAIENICEAGMAT